jgi:hypothetical protein
MTFLVETRPLMKGFSLSLAVGLMLVSNSEQAAAQTPDSLAFPGAEGFGRFTVGGRGGVVLHVTDLGDASTGQLYNAFGAPVESDEVASYGEGTLRWALEGVPGPRYVVFDIGGVANLTSGLIKPRIPRIVTDLRHPA